MATPKKDAGKTGKKPLHPALQANADKLRRGEPLSPGTKKRPASAKTSPKKSTVKSRGGKRS